MFRAVTERIIWFFKAAVLLAMQTGGVLKRGWFLVFFGSSRSKTPYHYNYFASPMEMDISLLLTTLIFFSPILLVGVAGGLVGGAVLGLAIGKRSQQVLDWVAQYQRTLHKKAKQPNLTTRYWRLGVLFGGLAGWGLGQVGMRIFDASVVVALVGMVVGCLVALLMSIAWICNLITVKG